MRIPKIIHQTWAHDDIPQHFEELKKTWLDHHPDWTYRFWNDETNHQFVKKYYPTLLDAYESYETNIQRADLIRYLILSKIGGVYVDLDFECYANLEPLLKDHSCVFSTEPEAHCKMHAIDNLVCNAFMASVPKHPFIKLLIEEAIKPVQQDLNRNDKVMESTGPFMVTRVYNNHPGLKDLTILDPKFVYPLTRNEVIYLLNCNKVPKKIQKKLDQSVAVHYWLNSWVS